MLLNARSLHGETINQFDLYPEAWRAFTVGNLALLGEGCREPEQFEGSIADLLLQSPSTAIMHFEAPAENCDENEPMFSNMIAVNYHDGHSEGYHKIVVQDPLQQEIGQHELWIPPGLNNRIFRPRLYLGSATAFEKYPANPDKIKKYYIHFGPSDEAYTSFEQAGFIISDEPRTREEYWTYGHVSREAQSIWEPPTLPENIAL